MTWLGDNVRREFDWGGRLRKGIGGAQRFPHNGWKPDVYKRQVIAEYAAGSDLFICEGMYGEKEKASKAREYKHMTFYEAAACLLYTSRCV